MSVWSFGPDGRGHQVVIGVLALILVHHHFLATREHRRPRRAAVAIYVLIIPGALCWRVVDIFAQALSP